MDPIVLVYFLLGYVLLITLAPLYNSGGKKLIAEAERRIAARLELMVRFDPNLTDQAKEDLIRRMSEVK